MSGLAIKQVWDSLYNKEVVKNPALKQALGSNETSVFIYDLNRDNFVTFNLVPDSLQENYKPRFSTESSIWGRSTPLHFYTGGESKTLSFSFTIHEDLLPLHNTNKSRGRERENIYNFLDGVKELSSPLVTNRGSSEQTLKPPRVYLQIGNQFAGKGFLETGWNYSTPYRQGRYIKVDIDLTFTYDIEYETPEVNLLSSSEEIITQDYLLDIDDSLFDSDKFGSKLSELVPTYLSYDYLRTYVYETQKLHNQYNYDSMTPEELEARFTYYKPSPTITLSDRDITRGERTINPYLVLLALYFQDLVEITNPGVSMGDRVRALITLRQKIDSLREDYNAKQGKYSYFSQVDGTYFQGTMTRDEKEMFETEIKKLEVIVETQLTVLQQVIGGGN